MAMGASKNNREPPSAYARKKKQRTALASRKGRTGTTGESHSTAACKTPKKADGPPVENTRKQKHDLVLDIGTCEKES